MDYVEIEKLPGPLGRFHAWYNRQLTEADEKGEDEWDTLGPGGKNPKGERNYPIADVQGKATLWGNEKGGVRMILYQKVLKIFLTLVSSFAVMGREITTVASQPYLSTRAVH